MNDDILGAISGAAELRDWFGGFPSFHDANAHFTLRSDGTAEFVVDGFRMTNRTDADGYFILEKHFRATLHLEEIRSASFEEFLPGRIILFGLSFQRAGDHLAMSWETSYGASGTIVAVRIRLEFGPGNHVV